MGIVEKVKEDYSPTFTPSTWVLLNVEKAREDACCCRELIREQEGLGPVIRLIASTSPGAPCQAPPHQAHLVKPHLVNPHLAKPSLSNPTSTCLDFFQPITTSAPDFITKVKLYYTLHLAPKKVLTLQVMTCTTITKLLYT